MTKRQKEFEQFWLKVGEETGQLEKWRQEGAHQTRIETARNFRNLGVSIETISQATGLAPARDATSLIVVRLFTQIFYTYFLIMPTFAMRKKIAGIFHFFLDKPAIMVYYEY